MSSSSFSPEEIRAAAEVHGELGPDYQRAVIDSFLDKVGKEIDARVDARLAAGSVRQHPAAVRKPTSPVAVLAITMTLGIPLSAIALAVGAHPAGLAGLLVVWIAITAINIAYAIGRPPGGGR